MYLYPIQPLSVNKKLLLAPTFRQILNQRLIIRVQLFQFALFYLHHFVTGDDHIARAPDHAGQHQEQ